MSSIEVDELRDEISLHWNWLEAERDPCVVVSDRMEFVYANTAARKLVPEHWFGKHCFELLPVVDQTCAFHCPKITSVTEATDVVYCEETVCLHGQECEVFGVGLIPLGTGRADRGRAVLLMRGKDVVRPEPAFETRLLMDAEAVGTASWLGAPDDVSPAHTGVPGVVGGPEHAADGRRAAVCEHGAWDGGCARGDHR